MVSKKAAMHLTIVTPYPPATTGIGQYGYYISRALADTGALERVTVLTHATSELEASPVPAGMVMDRVWHQDSLAIGWQLAARIAQINPDVVWFNLGTT
ncbi:MAG TPA: hypothetical protein VGK87_14485, partial [Anaerolineae bacterium]